MIAQPVNDNDDIVANAARQILSALRESPQYMVAITCVWMSVNGPEFMKAVQLEIERQVTAI